MITLRLDIPNFFLFPSSFDITSVYCIIIVLRAQYNIILITKQYFLINFIIFIMKFTNRTYNIILDWYTGANRSLNDDVVDS